MLTLKNRHKTRWTRKGADVIDTIPFLETMTAFDEALGIAENVNENKLRMGEKLRQAMDDEERTTREFAMARDGNFEKEDTYRNYVKAARFLILVKGLEEYETIRTLDISYLYVAFDAWNSQLDFEDVVELLLDVFRTDGKRKGVRWLRLQYDDALGRSKGFSDYIKRLQSFIKSFRPIAVGKKDSMNEKDADKAGRLVVLMDEITEILNEE